MGFEIGQIFKGKYPPEAAVFCNLQAYPIQRTKSALCGYVQRDRRISETDWYMMPDYPAEAAREGGIVSDNKTTREDDVCQ